MKHKMNKTEIKVFDRYKYVRHYIFTWNSNILSNKFPFWFLYTLIQVPILNSETYLVEVTI